MKKLTLKQVEQQYNTDVDFKQKFEVRRAGGGARRAAAWRREDHEAVGRDGVFIAIVWCRCCISEIHCVVQVVNWQGCMGICELLVR